MLLISLPKLQNMFSNILKYLNYGHPRVRWTCWLGIQFVSKDGFWRIFKILVFSHLQIFIFSQTFFIYLFNEDLSIEQVFCVIRAHPSDPVGYLLLRKPSPSPCYRSDTNRGAFLLIGALLIIPLMHSGSQSAVPVFFFPGPDREIPGWDSEMTNFPGWEFRKWRFPCWISR